MKKRIDCFAQLQEKYLLERYPRLDEFIPRMMGMKDDPETTYPDWCYLPMSASYAIVTNGADVGIAQRYMGNIGMSDFHIMSAIIPWRVGRPVYRFDDALAEELMQTEADEDDVPADVLKSLPFPCVCIEHPQGLPECECLYAFLEYDYRYKDTIELRMHYAYADEMVGLYLQWTPNRPSLNRVMMMDDLRNSKHANAPENFGHFGECYDIVRKHVNLVLYLCSNEPDIKRSSPIPRVRGADNRQKIAAYPDKIDVGTYIGAAIRTARAESRANGVPSGSSTQKRPHVRRAHWHLYWTGEGRATPSVKWIMPVFVHSEQNADGAVIRTVK